MCKHPRNSPRMDRSLEEEDEGSGFHVSRVMVWGLQDKVMSMKSQREREDRGKKKLRSLWTEAL